MTRRLMVAGIAVAASVALAPAAHAAQKNTITIKGGAVFKAGKFLKLDLRFTPADVTVKSGATVKVLNKGDDPEPHTVSFVKKKFLPKSFDFAAAGPLMAAHQVDPNNEEAPPGVLVVDNNAPAAPGALLNVDSLGDDKQAGDSQFIAPGQKSISFKVTAKKGSVLPYYCAVHPWMQGKITVR
jgi:plastocyanin